MTPCVVHLRTLEQSDVRRLWGHPTEPAAGCWGAVACAGGGRRRGAGLRHNPDKTSRALSYPECGPQLLMGTRRAAPGGLALKVSLTTAGGEAGTAAPGG